MKKDGFTLVELLAVIVIIGVIAAISITIYSSTINDSKENLSNVQKDYLIEATRTYVAVNTINFNDKFRTMERDSQDSCVAVGVDALTAEGLIGTGIRDPKDESIMTGYIKVTYSNNNQYEYTYMSETINNTICKYVTTINGNQVEIIEK